MTFIGPKYRMDTQDTVCEPECRRGDLLSPKTLTKLKFRRADDMH